MGETGEMGPMHALPSTSLRHPIHVPMELSLSGSEVTACCRSKPTDEQRQATRRARRLLGHWQALLPRRRPAIQSCARRLWRMLGVSPDLYPIRKVLNVLQTVCMRTKTRVNISPSRGVGSPGRLLHRL